MQEKRQYIRWVVCLPVKYKIEDREEEFKAYTKDIGNGGISIYPSQNLPLNTRLDITINMPEDVGPINTTGKAIWQNETAQAEDKNFLVGIKFISLTYSDRDRIFNYLSKHHNKELVKRWWTSD